MNATALALAAAGGLAWWLLSSRASASSPGGGGPNYVTPGGPWQRKETELEKNIRELTTPRGIRNRNPGNLVFVPVIKWQGQLGADSEGYVIFATPEDGVRAAALDLLTGFRRDGEDTIREIIAEWAPSHENPTDAYMHFVAERTGYGLDQVLTPTQPVLEALIRAIGHFENGAPLETWWPPSVVERGVARALAA